MTTSRILFVSCLLMMTSACDDDDNDTGVAELSWELANATTMDAVACGSGDIVRVTMGDVVTDFDCDATRGTTNPIDEGTYTATVDLIDSGGTVLSTSSFTVSIIDSGVTDMGLVRFLVE